MAVMHMVAGGNPLPAGKSMQHMAVSVNFKYLSYWLDHSKKNVGDGWVGSVDRVVETFEIETSPLILLSYSNVFSKFHHGCGI